MKTILAMILILAGLSAPALRAADTSSSVESRSEDQWRELAQSDMNQFMQEMDNATQLTEGKVQSCGQKVGAYYADHPEYFEELARQQKSYQTACRNQCKAASTGEITGCGFPAVIGVPEVKEACEQRKSVCATDPDPAIQANLLQCDCEDLCEDPVITNYSELASKCGEGFVGVYSALGEIAKKAVIGIGEAGTSPNSTLDSLGNWWRNTFSSAQVSEKQIQRLIALKGELDGCRAATREDLQPDYARSKINQLAMGCTTLKARQQASADKAASTVCALVAPLPPIFVLTKFGKISTAVSEIYRAAKQGGKELLDQVLRTGAVPSPQQAQTLAKLDGADAKEVAKLFQNAEKAEAEKTLADISKECKDDLGWTPIFWIQDAYGAGVCAFRVAQRNLGSTPSAQTSSAEKLYDGAKNIGNPPPKSVSNPYAVSEAKRAGRTVEPVSYQEAGNRALQEAKSAASASDQASKLKAAGNNYRLEGDYQLANGQVKSAMQSLDQSANAFKQARDSDGLFGVLRKQGDTNGALEAWKDSQATTSAANRMTSSDMGMSIEENVTRLIRDGRSTTSSNWTIYTDARMAQRFYEDAGQLGAAGRMSDVARRYESMFNTAFGIQ